MSRLFVRTLAALVFGTLVALGGGMAHAQEQGTTFPEYRKYIQVLFDTEEECQAAQQWG